MRDFRLDDLAGYLAIAIALITAVTIFVFALPAIGYISLSSVRDPVNKIFGLAAYIFGTLYVSLIAISLAAPIGILTALYLGRYARDELRRYYSMIIEAMASIPSVVYGLRGLLVLGSLMTIRANKLVASITLSLMLLPTIISLSRAAIESVPIELKEAAYALGAMDHEVALLTLSYLRPKLIGAILIAFMRAVGETMAVTMTIGNVARISFNPLDPGSTLTSLIATEFGGAMDPIHRSAILFAAFVLIVLSVSIYSLARRVISSGEKS